MRLLLLAGLILLAGTGLASSDSVGRYIAPEGRLTIREGAVVARAHESEAVRATLTFVDRGGHAHVASVTLGCGV